MYAIRSYYVFDPAAPAALIEQGVLPESVRVFTPEGGTIGNVSFVAIPFNAAHRAGAVLIRAVESYNFV